MEEAELLGALAERLAGLISVTSALKRARRRELSFQKQAESADERAEALKSRLTDQHRGDQLEAEARVANLRATAHGPASQIKKQELEDHALSPTLLLLTPPGVDPIPWAAHAHLYRNVEARPFVVVDLSAKIYRHVDAWQLDAKPSPWHRAGGGTLVLCYPSALPSEFQLSLCEALDKFRPPFVIACRNGRDKLLPRLERQLQGPIVQLPTLADRGEDLQALIINELSQLGLAEQGAPYGIERAALHQLIQRDFPGNDAELRGVLTSAVGKAKGELITVAEIHSVLDLEDSVPAPIVTEKRSRSRPAPRSRRR
jgi:hypothetical protein